MSDQIEMWWRCKTCGLVNGGGSKQCGSRPVEGGRVVPPRSDLGCGKIQEDEEWFFPEDISHNAAVTDEKMLRDARSGPAWVCGYCGSTVRRIDGQCSNCGGDPNFNASERAKEMSVTETPEGVRTVETLDTPWKKGRERVDTLNETPSSKRSYRPRPNVRAVTGIRPPDDFWDDEKEEDERMLSSASRRRPFPTVPFVIGSVVIAVTALLFFLLWPRYADAKVTSVNWTSTVSIDRYQKVPGEGWDVPPDAVEVQNMGQRVRDRKQVQDGTESKRVTSASDCGEDCHIEKGQCRTTPRECKDNKNGFSTCTGGDRVCDDDKRVCNPKSCNIQVPKFKWVDIKDDWYAWKVWRWQHDRNVVRQGSDLNPLPPEKSHYKLNMGCVGQQRERASAPSWKYVSTFTDEKGKTYNYSPKNEGEFKSLPVGTEKRLRLVAGTVTIVEGK